MLRERRSFVVPFAIWVTLSLVAGITGPFDTYEILPLPQRLFYWAVITGLSVLVDAVFRRLFKDRSQAARILGRLPFSLVLGSLIHALNTSVFSFWQGWRDHLYLIAIVALVSALVEILVFVIRHQNGLQDSDPADDLEPTPDTPPDPQAAFLRRLAPELRGPLIRLEAQDHYLRAVTTVGEALILLRMGDAEAELAEVDGMRVHRSHWIARVAVTGHLRRSGRDFLQMTDGAEVPVSRSFRAATLEAGFLPDKRS